MSYLHDMMHLEQAGQLPTDRRSATIYAKAPPPHPAGSTVIGMARNAEEARLALALFCPPEGYAVLVYPARDGYEVVMFPARREVS